MDFKRDIKVIFWDFDGVILDSMSIRERGFRELFKHYDADKIERLLLFHRENGGLSRYVKIRYFFEKILLVPITEEKVAGLAKKFSVLMRQLLVNKDLLIGDSMAFIETQSRNYSFFIISGSDGDELRYLCKELGIAQYFFGIEGSPISKTELIAGILRREKCDVSQCVLIGDSKNDLDAAQINGVRFWGYNNPELKFLGEKYIDTFNEFLCGGK